jgi:hypothetical protein
MAATIAETTQARQAERFARTVRNVASYPVDTDISFDLGGVHVAVWVPLPLTWVVSAIEVAEDFSEVTRLATMGVSPDQTGESALAATYTHPELGVIQAADFKGSEAALAFALAWVCAAASGQQGEHDSFAV